MVNHHLVTDPTIHPPGLATDKECPLGPVQSIEVGGKTISAQEDEKLGDRPTGLYVAFNDHFRFDLYSGY